MSGVRESLDEAILFAVRLAREFPGLAVAGDAGIAAIAARLIRLGRKHGRLAEAECNRVLSAREKRAAAKNREDIARIVGLLGPGAGAVLSGDPRGATVKIKLPSGYSDSWGGEGLCVPGS